MNRGDPYSPLPWIKLYTNMPEHPKSAHLEGLLETSLAWAYVVRLWCWAARACPSGDLRKVPNHVIARHAGWDGDTEYFVESITKAGFLDADGKLHDWDEIQTEHEEKAARKKEQARLRKQKQRSKECDMCDIERDIKCDQRDMSRSFSPSPSYSPSCISKEGGVGGEQTGVKSTHQKETETQKPIESPVRAAPPETDSITVERIEAGEMDAGEPQGLAWTMGLGEALWSEFRKLHPVLPDVAPYSTARRNTMSASLSDGNPPSRILAALRAVCGSPFWRGESDSYRDNNPPAASAAWNYALKEPDGAIAKAASAKKRQSTGPPVPKDFADHEDWNMAFTQYSQDLQDRQRRQRGQR